MGFLNSSLEFETKTRCETISRHGSRLKSTSRLLSNGTFDVQVEECNLQDSGDFEDNEEELAYWDFRFNLASYSCSIDQERNRLGRLSSRLEETIISGTLAAIWKDVEEDVRFTLLTEETSGYRRRMEFRARVPENNSEDERTLLSELAGLRKKQEKWFRDNFQTSLLDCERYPSWLSDQTGSLDWATLSDGQRTKALKTAFEDSRRIQTSYMLSRVEIAFAAGMRALITHKGLLCYWIWQSSPDGVESPNAESGRKAIHWEDSDFCLAVQAWLLYEMKKNGRLVLGELITAQTSDSTLGIVP